MIFIRITSRFNFYTNCVKFNVKYNENRYINEILIIFYKIVWFHILDFGQCEEWSIVGICLDKSWWLPKELKKLKEQNKARSQFLRIQVFFIKIGR